MSGGKDGVIILWSNEFTKISVIDLKTNKNIFNSKITSLDFNPITGNILVGTKSSQIIEV